jgi:hypothetical protein
MERVLALIQESELRQRQLLRTEVIEAIAEFDARRFRQFRPVVQTVESLRTETQSQRRELNALGSAVVGANQLVRLRLSGQ